MAKAKRYEGSFNVSKFLELLESGDSSFVKLGNGEVHFNYLLWLNEQPDNYNNLITIKSDPLSKDNKSVFIGNGKNYNTFKSNPASLDNKELILITKEAINKLKF